MGVCNFTVPIRRYCLLTVGSAFLIRTDEGAKIYEMECGSRISSQDSGSNS